MLMFCVRPHSAPPILFRPPPSPPTCPPSAMTIQPRDSERGHGLASNSVSRLPPPTLSERRHRSLACRLVAVRRGAVLVLPVAWCAISFGACARLESRRRARRLG